MINRNNIELIGTITKISDIKTDKNNNKYLFFDIAQNEYLNNQIINTSYYKIRLINDLLKKYKSILNIGTNIYVKGCLRSYRKDNIQVFYIYPLVIKYLDKNFNLEREHSPVIDYDIDGVMLWNGKRCVSEPMDEETRKELEEFINEYR